MADDFEVRQYICGPMEEASHLIDQGYYEEAIPKLNHCLQMENELSSRQTILCELGYCFLAMGWYEDAVRIFSQYLQTSPFDNDARFYLASAYSSMRWFDESIAELKKILASDPTDVLTYHALGLCYRDKGWLKDSLDMMKKAKEQSTIHGSPEETEIIDQSLADLEKEIEKGEDDKLRAGVLLAVLLATMKRKKKKAP